MDPFGLFPVKVWEEILRRLEIPLDKLNLIKTHRSLEQLELFQESGDEWHFSAVIGIVLSYLNEENDNLKKPWYDMEGLKSAVVNCRLVSKSVKKIVDSVLELHWENYSYNAPSASVMDTFHTLPILVCEEILDQLKNPLDKLNLIEAYPHLAHLEYYQQKKTEWGFSAILKPFLKNFYLDKRSYEPELKSAVRNCRLLCKGTKKIVDSFVDFYWGKFWNVAPFASPFPLNCLEHVDKCLAQADQLQRNNRSISPFICGGLLDIFCGEGWYFDQNGNVISVRPSLEKAVQLISHPNIGVNLRGVRINAKFGADDLQGRCNFVRNLFHSGPNLVRLSIYLLCPVGNVNRAEPEMAVPPLPVLPHLRVLEMHGNNEYENEAYSVLQDKLDLRQYFAQLTGLEISIFLWKETYASLSAQLQLKYLMLHNIPIVGWNERLLDIIAKLPVPTLEMLALKTVIIHLEEEDGPECVSFNKFVIDDVREAILCHRPGWNFSLTIEYLTREQDIVVLTYNFPHRGCIDRR